MMATSYLSRPGLAVAQVGSKVLGVAPEEVKGPRPAHRRKGLPHHLIGGSWLILVVQEVVDPALVGPHYIPKLLLHHAVARGGSTA